jgi:hypothetical protein
VVKFIETGRISPTGFPEVFKNIYRAVDETVRLSATGRFAHWLNLLDKGRLDQGCAFLPTWD